MLLQGATIRSAAWAAAGEGLEKRKLRLGFVPLIDAAPLVIAKERGFFRRHGLEVTLSREVSWANVRDNLAAGVLDAAQMLAPMPLASTLGVGARAVPMLTALSLDLNGNAITVSADLYRRMREVDPAAVARRPVSAAALAQVIEEDRRAGRRPLVFAVVFPFSAHNYELRYWLATGGVDPERDVEMRIVPPSLMAEKLEEGSIDGYCVGEPWNEYAVYLGLGRTVATSYEIWNNSPEKVLGVTRGWAERHPATHRALIRALIDAARWIDRPENRLETVHLLAAESYVDAPVEAIVRALRGGARTPDADALMATGSSVFYRFAATFPWRSHAVWFVSQMLRWGQIERPLDVAALVDAVYRPDVYREAADELGVPAPLADMKREGEHDGPWLLDAATQPIAMGPDRFLDGRVFDPHDPSAYLAGFPIHAARVSFDELARCGS
ncbi:MAG: CmpA/NrtA family ABC transporter substrate-binding protein [Thermodesulfobacteriota bacterium]